MHTRHTHGGQGCRSSARLHALSPEDCLVMFRAQVFTVRPEGMCAGWLPLPVSSIGGIRYRCIGGEALGPPCSTTLRTITLGSVAAVRQRAHGKCLTYGPSLGNKRCFCMQHDAQRIESRCYTKRPSRCPPMKEPMTILHSIQHRHAVQYAQDATHNLPKKHSISKMDGQIATSQLDPWTSDSLCCKRSSDYAGRLAHQGACFALHIICRPLPLAMGPLHTTLHATFASDGFKPKQRVSCRLYPQARLPPCGHRGTHTDTPR